MTNDFDGDALRKRLDVIIQLLLEDSPRYADTITKKVESLKELGLSNVEIAQVIDKKPNYVAAVISGKKRSGKKQKGGAL